MIRVVVLFDLTLFVYVKYMIYE